MKRISWFKKGENYLDNKLSQFSVDLNSKSDLTQYSTHSDIQYDFFILNPVNKTFVSRHNLSHLIFPSRFPVPAHSQANNLQYAAGKCDKLITIQKMLQINDSDVVIHLCTFQVCLTQAKVNLRFPSLFFVEWKTINSKQSVAMIGRKRAINSAIDLEQTLTFSTEMIYHRVQKQYLKKESLLHLNLISNSRPDQIKLVGRIVIDFADIANNQAYSSLTTAKLMYCSVDAEITFRMQFVRSTEANMELNELQKSAFSDLYSFSSPKSAQRHKVDLKEILSDKKIEEDKKRIKTKLSDEGPSRYPKPTPPQSLKNDNILIKQHHQEGAPQASQPKSLPITEKKKETESKKLQLQPVIQGKFQQQIGDMIKKERLALQMQLNQHKNRIKRLQTDIKAAMKMFEQSQQKSQHQKSKLLQKQNVLNQFITRQNKLISECQVKIAKLKEQHGTQMQIMKSGYEADIKILKSTIEEEKLKVQALQTASKNFEKKYEEAKSKVKQQQLIIFQPTNLVTQIQALKKQKQLLSHQLTLKTDTVNSLNSQLLKNKIQFQNVTKQLQQQLANLRNTQPSKDQLLNQQNKYQAIQSQLNQQKESNTQLKALLQQLVGLSQTKIKSLQQELIQTQQNLKQKDEQYIAVLQSIKKRQMIQQAEAQKLIIPPTSVINKLQQMLPIPENKESLSPQTAAIAITQTGPTVNMLAQGKLAQQISTQRHMQLQQELLNHKQKIQQLQNILQSAKLDYQGQIEKALNDLAIYQAQNAKLSQAVSKNLQLDHNKLSPQNAEVLQQYEQLRLQNIRISQQLQILRRPAIQLDVPREHLKSDPIKIQGESQQIAVEPKASLQPNPNSSNQNPTNLNVNLNLEQRLNSSGEVLEDERHNFNFQDHGQPLSRQELNSMSESKYPKDQQLNGLKEQNIKLKEELEQLRYLKAVKQGEKDELIKQKQGIVSSNLQLIQKLNEQKEVLSGQIILLSQNSANAINTVTNSQNIDQPNAQKSNIPPQVLTDPSTLQQLKQAISQHEITKSNLQSRIQELQALISRTSQQQSIPDTSQKQNKWLRDLQQRLINLQEQLKIKDYLLGESERQLQQLYAVKYELSELKQLHSGLQKELNQRDIYINQLQQTKEYLSKEIEQFQQNKSLQFQFQLEKVPCTQEHPEHHSISVEVNDFKGQIQALHRQLVSLNNQNTELKGKAQDIANQKMDMDKIIQQLRLKQIQHSKFSSQLMQLQQKLKENQLVLQQLKQLKIRQAQNEHNINQLKIQKQSISCQLQEANVREAEDKKIINNLGSTIEQLQANKSENDKINEGQFNDKLTQLTQQLQKQRQTQTELLNQLAIKDQQLSGHLKKIQQINNQSGNLRVQNENLLNLKAQQQAKIIAHQSQISQLNAQIASLTQQTTLLQAQISSYTQQTGQIPAQIASLTNQIAQLQAQISLQTEQTAKLQIQANSHKQLADQLQQQIVTHNEITSQLKAQIVSQTELNGQLQTQIASQTEQTGHLQAQIASQTELNTQLQQRITAMVQQNSKLQQELSQAKSINASINPLLQQANLKIAQLNDQLSQANAKIQQLCLKLQNNLKERSQQLPTVQVHTVESYHSQNPPPLNYQVSTIVLEENDHQKVTQEMQKQIEKLKKEIETLQGQLAQESEQKFFYFNAVQNQKSKTGKLQEQITKLQDQTKKLKDQNQRLTILPLQSFDTNPALGLKNRHQVITRDARERQPSILKAIQVRGQTEPTNHDEYNDSPKKQIEGPTQMQTRMSVQQAQFLNKQMEILKQELQSQKKLHISLQQIHKNCDKKYGLLSSRYQNCYQQLQYYQAQNQDIIKAKQRIEEQLYHLTTSLQRAKEIEQIKTVASPDIAGKQGSPDVAGKQGSPDVAGKQGSPDVAGKQGSPDVAGKQGSPDVAGKQGEVKVEAHSQQNQPGLAQQVIPQSQQITIPTALDPVLQTERYQQYERRMADLVKSEEQYRNKAAILEQNILNLQKSLQEQIQINQNNQRISQRLQTLNELQSLAQQFRAQMTELKKENEDLRKVKQNIDPRSEIGDLTKIIEQHGQWSQERAQWQQKLQQIQQMLSLNESKFVSQKNELQEKVQHLQEEKAKLQAQKSFLVENNLVPQQRLKQNENILMQDGFSKQQQLLKQIEQIRAQKLQQLEKVAQLQQKINTISSTQSAKQLQMEEAVSLKAQEIEELHFIKQQLSRQLEDHKMTQLNQLGSQQQHQILRHSYEQSLSQVQHLKAQAVKYAQKLQALEQQIADLQNNIKILEEEKAQSSAFQHLSSQVDKLQVQMANKIALIQQIQAANSQLSKDIDNINQQLQQNSAALQQKQAEKQSLRGELNQVRILCEELKKKKQEMEEQIKSFNKKQTNIDQQSKTLKESMDIKEVGLQKLKKNMEDKQKQVTNLLQKLKEKQNQAIKLSKETQQLKLVNGRNQQKIKNLAEKEKQIKQTLTVVQLQSKKIVESLKAKFESEDAYYKRYVQKQRQCIRLSLAAAEFQQSIASNERLLYLQQQRAEKLKRQLQVLRKGAGAQTQPVATIQLQKYEMLVAANEQLMNKNRQYLQTLGTKSTISIQNQILKNQLKSSSTLNSHISSQYQQIKLQYETKTGQLTASLMAAQQRLQEQCKKTAQLSRLLNQQKQNKINQQIALYQNLIEEKNNEIQGLRKLINEIKTNTDQAQSKSAVATKGGAQEIENLNKKIVGLTNDILDRDRQIAQLKKGIEKIDTLSTQRVKPGQGLPINGQKGQKGVDSLDWQAKESEYKSKIVALEGQLVNVKNNLPKANQQGENGNKSILLSGNIENISAITNQLHTICGQIKQLCQHRNLFGTQDNIFQAFVKKYDQIEQQFFSLNLQTSKIQQKARFISKQLQKTKAYIIKSQARSFAQKTQLLALIKPCERAASDLVQLSETMSQAQSQTFI